MSIAAREYSNVVDITGHGEQVSREELFARQYIQDIDPFPELEVRLTRVFGPTPEMVMLHQLIYWFSKKKMQNRWTLYKTFEEWRDERGLNRKQVDKARKRLAPTGIVTELKGPYKRVHFRINWVRLRDVLDGGRLYPLKGGQSMTVPPLGESEESVPPKGGSITTVPPLGESVPTDPPQMDDTPLGNGENPPVGGGQSNTGTYAGEYVKNPDRNLLSGNTPLQGGENGFSSRPSPPQINKNFSQEQNCSTTSFDGSPKLDAELLSEVKAVLSEAPRDNAAEVLKRHRSERFDSVYVMEAVCRELGYGYLSEDMRRHVSEAMKQLDTEEAAS